MEAAEATAQGNWANVPKLEQSVHNVLLPVLPYRKAAAYEDGFAGITET